MAANQFSWKEFSAGVPGGCVSYSTTSAGYIRGTEQTAGFVDTRQSFNEFLAAVKEIIGDET